MKQSFLAVAIAAVVATDALATECPKIDNDLGRLACNDKEAGRNPRETIVETAGFFVAKSHKTHAKLIL